MDLTPSFHFFNGLLRSHGIDVTTTADAGLLGATDEEQLAHALAEGRVLVTHNIDFLPVVERITAAFATVVSNSTLSATCSKFS